MGLRLRQPAGFVQTSPCHLDSRQTKTRRILPWLNKRLPALGAKLQCARPPGPGCDEFRSLCEAGQLDKALSVLFRMDQQQNIPSVNMYTSLLKACSKRKALVQAKRVCAHIAQHGLESIQYVGEEMVSTLAKCGSPEDALEVFQRLQHRTVFCWTAVIASYADTGQGKPALKLYEQMQADQVQPNRFTFVSLIKACGSTADLMEGKRIHAQAWKHGCESDLFVGACLVHMYWKCGSIADAQIVFDRLSDRNVVSWTAMLSAYAADGQGEKVLQLYERMQEEGVSPDARALVSVLQGCGVLAEKEVVDNGQSVKVKSLQRGRAVHVKAQRNGYNSNLFVCSTLVSMYGKCRSIADAWNVFDGLIERDAISWNAMLEAYVAQGQGEETLQLYRQMLQAGGSPNEHSFVSMFQACGMLAGKEVSVTVDGRAAKVEYLETGKALHAGALKKGYGSDVFVGSALINMYGKCGSITDAQNVFEGLSQRNVIVWTAMLAAYGEQGQAEKALQLYRQMQQQGVSLNEVTRVCILQACSKSGSLGIVRQIHDSLVCNGDELNPFLASTLVSAYGRCASMVDAQAVFDTMRQPDVVSWNALIGAYARQGTWAASLQSYEEMRQAGMRPDSLTFLSLLIACSHAGLVDEGAEYFESMSMDHGIEPDIEHYASMVDLFGRAGCFTRLEHLLSSMPMQPDLAIWLCVLGACQKYREVVLGEHAFKCAVHLQPKHPAAYVLMSNIYSDAGSADLAKRVTKLRQKEGAWKVPGQSWIELKQEVHTFLVGDCSQPQHAPLVAGVAC